MNLRATATQIDVTPRRFVRHLQAVPGPLVVSFRDQLWPSLTPARGGPGSTASDHLGLQRFVVQVMDTERQALFGDFLK
jgi:hypothetical protein